jgi:polyisoprenoid-binding protein YceI
MTRKILIVASLLSSGAALAEAATYTIDPLHTYPAFEADHMGGLSLWRGKFNTTAGMLKFDRAAKKGEVEVTVQVASINFGYDKMNEHARSAEMFDAAKFPTAVYKGKVSKWNGDVPTEVDGQLTLRGVTKPVKLMVNTFVCKQNPMTRKEVCGADAVGNLNRADFGVNYGANFGFKMETKLLISFEAVRN